MWKIAKFLPNPIFFYAIETNKLNIYRLNEDPIPIFLYLKAETNGEYFVYCDENSFDSLRSYPSRTTPILGTLYILNTIENIKNDFEIYKKKIQNQILDVLSIKSIDSVLQLFRCLLICYSDPKTHIINYIVYFPTIDLKMESNSINMSWKKFTNVFPEKNKNDTIKRINENLLGTSNNIPLLELNRIEPNSIGMRPIEKLLCYKDFNLKSNSLSLYLMNVLAYLLNTEKSENLQIVYCRISLSSVNIDSVLNVWCSKAFEIFNLNWLDDGIDFNQSNWYKSINLSSLLDREKLIKDTFLLNLRLMKWQLYPNLDIEKLSSLKCLLFGAGTLGCNVARNLLGWGITNITFIDNSIVSFSNPPRQSLYSLLDCIDGKTNKSDAAVESMKRIYEYGNYKGYNITIPSPGHPIHPTMLDEGVETVKLIEKLILEHDVIFLLTDSRESRWLPTLLASFHNKCTICTAIGGDSFLVIRHGLSDKTPTTSSIDKDLISSSDLGCYFCNDNCSLGNTLIGRSYDKRCSVSRPGISMMASAHAVELVISLFNQPRGFASPAQKNSNQSQTNISNSTETLPHQIRFFLSDYSLMLGSTEKSKRCSACSSYVINEFKNGGYNFILNVCSRPKILTSITEKDIELGEIDKQLEELLVDF